MNILKLAGTTLLISSAMAIIGCSSDDSSSSGATVPANAVVIDETNAETTVAGSVTTVSTLDSAFAVETTPTLGVLAALELIQPRIDAAKDALNNSGADPVYGVAVSESGDCWVSGTYSFTGDEGGTYPSFTDSGNVTLTNCDDGFGFVLNGSLNWVDSWNEETGDYSDTMTGSLSMLMDGFEFDFSNLDFAETGNDLIWGEETYTMTKGTFGIDFVIDGTSGGGYLVSLSAPIVESTGGWASCPESGHITVTGGNGTTAEGIYNGDGTMTIKANGVVVDAAAYCYY